MQKFTGLSDSLVTNLS